MFNFICEKIAAVQGERIGEVFGFFVLTAGAAWMIPVTRICIPEENLI